MAATLTNQFKLCATCGLWGGVRKANPPYPAIFVTVEPSEKGLCMGGGFNSAKTQAIATCGSWRKWDVLR